MEYQILVNKCYVVKNVKKRFTIDYGQLTHYSHQTQAAWNDFIVDTFHGNPLTHSVAKINISECTAFRMRHMFLHALEKALIISSTE